MLALAFDGDDSSRFFVRREVWVGWGGCGRGGEGGNARFRDVKLRMYQIPGIL